MGKWNRILLTCMVVLLCVGGLFAANNQLDSSLRIKSSSNANNQIGVRGGKSCIHENKKGYAKFIGAPRGRYFGVEPGPQGKLINKDQIAKAFINKHRKLLMSDSPSIEFKFKKFAGREKKSVITSAAFTLSPSLKWSANNDVRNR